MWKPANPAVFRVHDHDAAGGDAVRDHVVEGAIGEGDVSDRRQRRPGETLERSAGGAGGESEALRSPEQPEDVGPAPVGGRDLSYPGDRHLLAVPAEDRGETGGAAVGRVVLPDPWHPS